MASKKDKCDGSHQAGHLAIKINAIEVAKIDKKKVMTKDLRYIKCYAYI